MYKIILCFSYDRYFCKKNQYKDNEKKQTTKIVILKLWGNCFRLIFCTFILFCRFSFLIFILHRYTFFKMYQINLIKTQSFSYLNMALSLKWQHAFIKNKAQQIYDFFLRHPRISKISPHQIFLSLFSRIFHISYHQKKIQKLLL